MSPTLYTQAYEAAVELLEGNDYGSDWELLTRHVEREVGAVHGSAAVAQAVSDAIDQH